MAVRSVATTDTLDTFRTTFNSLASTDIGDPASLSTSATSIVGAINEVNTSIGGDLAVNTFGHLHNADGSNAYTQFTVTVATKTSAHIYHGSAGAYTQIVVADTTPNILYYQCSSHALMGSRIDIDSSTFVGASFVGTTGVTSNFASTNFAIAQAVALG